MVRCAPISLPLRWHLLYSLYGRSWCSSLHEQPKASGGLTVEQDVGCCYLSRTGPVSNTCAEQSASQPFQPTPCPCNGATVPTPWTRRRTSRASTALPARGSAEASDPFLLPGARFGRAQPLLAAPRTPRYLIHWRCDGHCFQGRGHALSRQR
jgi:hypothetical protein